MTQCLQPSRSVEKSLFIIKSLSISSFSKTANSSKTDCHRSSVFLFSCRSLRIFFSSQAIEAKSAVVQLISNASQNGADFAAGRAAVVVSAMSFSGSLGATGLTL